MKCPICQSKNVNLSLKSVPTVQHYKIQTTKKYNFYMCNNCYTLFVYPTPRSKEFDRVYNNPEYYTSWEKNPVRNMQIRYNNDFKKYKVFLSKIPVNEDTGQSKKILEVGCALGHFLYWTMPHFSELYGVEYSNYAIQHSLNNKFKISKEFFGKFDNNFFDVICAWDVFEHVPSVEEYIKECHRILRDGGYLILTTPNSQSISFKMFREKWIDITPPEHLAIYSKKSLNLLFKKYGFKHTYIQCSSRYSLNPALPIYTMVAKMFGTTPTIQMDKDYEKFRKKDSLSPFKKLVYFSYYKLASLISWPFNKLGYGDSLLAVAQK